MRDNDEAPVRRRNASHTHAGLAVSDPLLEDDEEAAATAEQRCVGVERDWVGDLKSTGAVRDQTLADLHQLMLRAAGHQVSRMRAQVSGLGSVGVQVLVNQSADEAMVAVLEKLDTFEGRSRFTTWAYKFGILQASCDVRRTAWRDREIELRDSDTLRDQRAGPEEVVTANHLKDAIIDAVTTKLTPHQRRITIALLVDQVPADVLAERLGTTRGALYKTLHDARTRLRASLTAAGYLKDATSSDHQGSSRVRSRPPGSRGDRP